MTTISNTTKQELLHQLINEFGEVNITPLVKAHEKWMAKFPEGTTSAWTKSMSLEALSFLDEQETYWTFVQRAFICKMYMKK